MRQIYTKTDDFIIIAVKNENEKLSHFIVADRNEQILTDKRFELASSAIEWGNKFMIAEGLIND